MTKEEAKAISAEFTRIAKKKGFDIVSDIFRIEGQRATIWRTRSNGFIQVHGCVVKMDGIRGNGNSLIPAKSFNIETIEDVPRIVDKVIERAKLLAATNADFQEKIRVAREHEQQRDDAVKKLVQ